MISHETMEDEEMEKLVLTLTEAADAASVSVPTMRMLVYDHHFPAMKVGRKWLIPVDSFKAWLNEQAAGRAQY